jgi:hypothetical protein
MCSLTKTLCLFAVLISGCFMYGETSHHGVWVHRDTLESCRLHGRAMSCGELADIYRNEGKRDVAWGFVVHACEMSNPTGCASAWRRHNDLAPTRTEALELLHEACSTEPAACGELASWHARRGHSSVSQDYESKRPGARMNQLEAKSEDEKFDAYRQQLEAESEERMRKHREGFNPRPVVPSASSNSKSRPTGTCPGATKPSTCTGRVCACVAQD